MNRNRRLQKVEVSGQEYVASYDDGSAEVVTCYNCSRHDIRVLNVHVRPGAEFKVLTSTTDSIPVHYKTSLSCDGACGICDDPECIEFSTAVLVYNPSATHSATPTNENNNAV
jgi:hypothetical protein